MKTLMIRVGMPFTVLAAMAAFYGPLQAEDDINQVFQMGRAAYYKGDLKTAYQLLTQVESRNPRHFETKALLAQIRAQNKSGPNSVKGSYEAVTLAKIEFTEVSLTEAVEGLRSLSKTVTDGKVVPNIIIKDPALGAKTLSLNLSNVPLTDAIQYLADLVGAKTSYDRHAVIFTSVATVDN